MVLFKRLDFQKFSLTQVWPSICFKHVTQYFKLFVRAFQFLKENQKLIREIERLSRYKAHDYVFAIPIRHCRKLLSLVFVV